MDNPLAPAQTSLATATLDPGPGPAEQPAPDAHPPPLRLTGHVPALDGLRGIAVLLVLLVHFTPTGEASTLLGRITKAIAGIGGTGVDLFFVLSGFLITGILLDAKGRPRYFRTFYARRALRIFPLYYGVLLVALVIVPTFLRDLSSDQQRVLGDQSWLWLYASNFKAAFSNIERPFSADWMQMDHFWSLAVEEQFYLVWPLVVLVLSRRKLIGACLVLIGGALMLRIWLHRVGNPGMAFYVLTPCRIDQLAAGALITVLGRDIGAAKWLVRLAPAVLVASGALLTLTWSTDLRSFVTGGTLLAAFFGAMLIIAVAGKTIPRLLRFLPLRATGRYSYAMYVLHPFLLAVMTRHVPYARLGEWTGSRPLGVCLFIAMGFGGSFLAGWLSWRLFESHFLRLKRFFEYSRASRPS